MPRQSSPSEMNSGAAEREDVRRVLGDLDDSKVMAILALRPTISDLEMAAMAAAGDADVLAKGGHPLVGPAAEIVEILVAEEEEAQDSR